jgi:outer membrane lipoprotein-sorting protein
MNNNRFSLLLAVLVIAVLAIASVSMASTPHSAAASRAYDQIELMRAARYQAAAAEQAYFDQRHGEWTAGVNEALALLQYRRGEWTGK